VLLKNLKNALPLKAPRYERQFQRFVRPPLLTNVRRNIVLVGQDAGPARRGPNGFNNREGLDGVLGMGWGSG